MTKGKRICWATIISSRSWAGGSRISPKRKLPRLKKSGTTKTPRCVGCPAKLFGKEALFEMLKLLSRSALYVLLKLIIIIKTLLSRSHFLSVQTRSPGPAELVPQVRIHPNPLLTEELSEEEGEHDEARLGSLTIARLILLNDEWRARIFHDLLLVRWCPSLSCLQGRKCYTVNPFSIL